MASSDNINPELLNRFNTMAADAARAGLTISIGSGYRTVEEQIQLRIANGCPDIWTSPASSCNIPTAIPGRSNHNHGLAIDFEGDSEADAWVAANASKYGLHLPVAGENWHLEMIDGEQFQDGAPLFDLATEMTQANPEDELANRLHSIMRIVGMGQPETEMPADFIGTSGVEGTSYQEEFVQGEPITGLEPGFEPGPPAEFSRLGEKLFQGVKTAGTYQNYARQQLKKYGWDDSEMNALIELWNRESGWSPTADNPESSAYGIAQFLNGTWAGTGIEKTSDPYRQVDAGLIYINSRFGSPSAALRFHDEHNWY